MSTVFYDNNGDRVAYRYSGGTERGCILEIEVDAEVWKYIKMVEDEYGNFATTDDVEKSANQVWVRYK